MTLTTKRRRVASTTTDNRPAPMLPTPSTVDRLSRWQVMLVKSSLGKLLTGAHDTNLARFVCQAPTDFLVGNRCYRKAFCRAVNTLQRILDASPAQYDLFDRLLSSADKLARTTHLQLSFNSTAIRLHRFDIYVQHLGDLPAATSAANQLENFEFSVAQMLQIGARPKR